MDLKNEFQEFLNIDKDNVSIPTSENILSYVQKDLKSFRLYIISKVIFIHTLVGFLTLLICPQFGISPFGGNSGLMKFLMQYDFWVCATTCGAIFIGSSSLAINLFLKKGELQYLYHHKYGIFLSLTFGSLLIFIILNKTLDPVHSMLSFEFSLVWSLSALFFALLFLQFIRLFKKNFNL